MPHLFTQGQLLYLNHRKLQGCLQYALRTVPTTFKYKSQSVLDNAELFEFFYPQGFNIVSYINYAYIELTISESMQNHISLGQGIILNLELYSTA
jgi:hypothetical protein